MIVHHLNRLEVKTIGVILKKILIHFYYWSKRWLMNFNVTQCHVISITNNKSSVLFYYKMNGVPLERVTKLFDLGLNVDSAPSWSPHINKIISKANRICGLIKRTLGWHAPQQTRSMLYCALARPILEYCTPLWSGTSFTNVCLVEQGYNGQ